MPSVLYKRPTFTVELFVVGLPGFSEPLQGANAPVSIFPESSFLLSDTGVKTSDFFLFGRNLLSWKMEQTKKFSAAAIEIFFQTGESRVFFESEDLKH